MQIEIHQNNTNETGMYKIWFTNTLGQFECRNLSEEEVFELLTDVQANAFLKGKFQFDVRKARLESLGVS